MFPDVTQSCGWVSKRRKSDSLLSVVCVFDDQFQKTKEVASSRNDSLAHARTFPFPGMGPKHCDINVSCAAAS